MPRTRCSFFVSPAPQSACTIVCLFFTEFGCLKVSEYNGFPLPPSKAGASFSRMCKQHLYTLNQQSKAKAEQYLVLVLHCFVPSVVIYICVNNQIVKFSWEQNFGQREQKKMKIIYALVFLCRHQTTERHNSGNFRYRGQRLVIIFYILAPLIHLLHSI